MTLSDIIIPFIAALIGWITNYIAIRMLFRPRRPVAIGGITFHGLIPKRQKELAENIGETVSKSLISHDDVTAVLRTPEVQERMSREVEGEIDAFLEKFLAGNPMVAMFLQGEMLEQVKGVLMQQFEARTPHLLEQIIGTLEDKVDFKAIVQRKIEGFDLGELEALIYRISANELKTIEVLGGVLGFIVGLVQVAIMHVL